MSEVSTTVKALLRQSRGPDRSSQSTVYITDESRYLVAALSQLLGKPRIRIMSELLQAAIQDAVDQLPNSQPDCIYQSPLGEEWPTNGQVVTARQFVKRYASELPGTEPLQPMSNEDLERLHALSEVPYSAEELASVEAMREALVASGQLPPDSEGE